MALKKGKCINFQFCEKYADSDKNIQESDELNFRCAGCGKPLQPIGDVRGGLGSRMGKIIAGGIGVLVLTTGLVLLLLQCTDKSVPPPPPPPPPERTPVPTPTPEPTPEPTPDDIISAPENVEKIQETMAAVITQIIDRDAIVLPLKDNEKETLYAKTIANPDVQKQAEKLSEEQKRQLFEQSLTEGQKNANAKRLVTQYLQEGIRYTKQNEFDNALKSFAAAEQFDKVRQYKDIYVNQAAVYLVMKPEKPDLAIERLNQALAIDDKSSITLFTMAVAKAHANNKVDAAVFLVKSINNGYLDLNNIKKEFQGYGDILRAENVVEALKKIEKKKKAP